MRINIRGRILANIAKRKARKRAVNKNGPEYVGLFMTERRIRKLNDRYNTIREEIEREWEL